MAGLWAETSDHDGQQPAKDFFLTYILKFLESVAVLCVCEKAIFLEKCIFLAETGIFLKNSLYSKFIRDQNTLSTYFINIFLSK